MPKKSNTEYRVEFIRKDSSLGLYAWLKDIAYIETWYHRTPEQQNELYQKGRTEPGGIVTYCDGYSKISYHQLWRAKDIGILDGSGHLEYENIPKETLDKYAILGKFWENLGGRWGGNFKNFRDIFHFEY